jgi:hypothetical protein
MTHAMAIVRVVASWGPASFENDIASDWFYVVEEAVDPGALISAALDDALGDADYLELDVSCQAVAAAELSASCAGQTPPRLPDHIRLWVDFNPHQPHDAEIDQAVQAVERVRAESDLRDQWDEEAEGEQSPWLREIDDLLARLGRSGTGDPATLSP